MKKYLIKLIRVASYGSYYSVISLVDDSFNASGFDSLVDAQAYAEKTHAGGTK